MRPALQTRQWMPLMISMKVLLLLMKSSMLQKERKIEEDWEGLCWCFEEIQDQSITNRNRLGGVGCLAGDQLLVGTVGLLRWSRARAPKWPKLLYQLPSYCPARLAGTTHLTSLGTSNLPFIKVLSCCLCFLNLISLRSN